LKFTPKKRIKITKLFLKIHHQEQESKVKNNKIIQTLMVHHLTKMVVKKIHLI